MNHFVNFMLMSPPGGGGQQGGSAGLLSLLPIVLIFGVFWFFMIRPQNKQRKETQRMLADLRKGDRVVTIGGVHGVVQSVRENSVILKVDENCKIEFTRSAIASMKEKGDSSGGESAD
ncbi:MAG: preprotein translocase subunit YajC [Treponema sp.]|nr:preprotein translocase subunit YajC [Treponema sp.]